MQDIKDLVKDAKLPPRTKNTEYCVRITHITDPHNFYVRPIKFSKLIKYIEKTTPTKDVPLEDALFSNQPIIFNLNSEIEGEPKYARGKIDLFSDTICRVFAIDYGFYKDVQLDLMWGCNECLVDIEPLAINCRLANCAPKGNSWGGAISAFTTFVGNECAHMTIVDLTPSQLIVKLDNTCATDIATVLALAGHTTLGYVHNDLEQITSVATPPPPTKVSYEFKHLKLNEALHVRVVSGRSLDGFYVAEVNDYKDYQKAQDDIDYYSTKAKAVEKDLMEYGDSVLMWGGFNRTHHRGFIKKIKGDSDNIIVQMVDTGEVKERYYGACKVPPEQCAKLPAVAIYCSIKGEVPYNLNMLFHPGREFVMIVQELGKQLYFETPNVVTISHFKN